MTAGDGAGYTVERRAQGVYEVVDAAGERTARVARFMPGPLINVEGAQLTSPALARAVAEAMNACADEIEGTARTPDSPSSPSGDTQLRALASKIAHEADLAQWSTLAHLDRRNGTTRCAEAVLAVLNSTAAGLTSDGAEGHAA